MLNVSVDLFSVLGYLRPRDGSLWAWNNREGDRWNACQGRSRWGVAIRRYARCSGLSCNNFSACLNLAVTNKRLKFLSFLGCRRTLQAGGDQRTPRQAPRHRRNQDEDSRSWYVLLWLMKHALVYICPYLRNNHFLFKALSPLSALSPALAWRLVASRTWHRFPRIVPVEREAAADADSKQSNIVITVVVIACTRMSLMLWVWVELNE
jgi:hypothetical protein